MPNSQEIYQQARQLLPLEKLRLAERLLADLDISTPEVDSVWHDEAAKRWQAYKDGQLKTISYEAVMQKYKP
ncbi:MAG: addiction module protein [Methylomonas sp.]|jgi:putative addiction module component (TIGR02574 family)|uniref:addiction module protein n=1 Tax=Methylomonas sp. TaxID=418 RepID=UPI0025EF6BE9|nr:addiction module protein [Methylomonas sp.]MCK9607434.1 addiction module protein [Methylomonas sp.]